MAEDFAKKGWQFAQRQSQQPSAQHSPFSPHPTSQHRQYSTLAPPPSKLSPPSLDSKRRGISNLSSSGGNLVPLMTGDVDNFPPKLKEVRTKLLGFMEEVVYPAERTLMEHQVSADRWKPHPLVEDMKVCPILLLLSQFSIFLSL